MPLKQNKLFWDMDNTLLHSFVADSEAHADNIIDLYSQWWEGIKFNVRNDGWYVSFVRDGTMELLDFSRELLGFEHVNMLTIGMREYALWANMATGLGFDPNCQIFPREDVLNYRVSPKFLHTNNVLIDNENFEHHCEHDHCKVAWLNNLPRENFLQIPGFAVWSEVLTPDWTANYVRETKERIIETFKKYETAI